MSLELGLKEYSIIDRLDAVTEILKRSVVSFDIDGVEINSARPAIEKFNRIFKTHYNVSDLTNYWSMVDLIKTADPTIEDPRAYAINLWNADDVFNNASPASGAWLLGNYVEQKGLSIHRITSRPSYVADVTREWYRCKMPWVDESKIHIQKNSPLIRDKAQLAEHKIGTINKLGVKYHFEDSFEEAEAIVTYTDANVVLVPATWNSNYIKPMDRIITAGSGFNKSAPRLISVFLNLYGRI